ncbi:MAG: MFS transporter [Actinobacteria bacterium]|nr:MFS transporter [Actinomycetota bacterium]MCA1721924.1 MFS transporter [Actinomycetota bacterium]
MDVAEPVTQAAAEKRALLLAFAVFGLFWGAWASLLPAIKQQTGLTDGQLGLALGAVALAALPMGPVAGRIADRLGAATVLRLGLMGFGLVAALPAFCTGGLALTLVLAVFGITTGFLDVVVNAATAAWERIEDDRLMAAGHGLFSAGTLVGSVSTGFLRSAGFGPRVVLPAVAVAVLVAAALQPTYRRPPPDATAPGRSRLGHVLLLIGVLVGFSFLLEDALQSWSALHLERDLGARPWVSGLGPGVFAVAMTVGRLGTHVLGKGPREEVVVCSGGLAVAAGALVVAVAPSPVPALLGLFLAGAGLSVLAPTLFSAVGRRAAAGREGAALGALSTLGYLGFLIGPPLVGLLSAATSLPAALGLLGVLGLALAVGGPLVLRAPARVDA